MRQEISSSGSSVPVPPTEPPGAARPPLLAAFRRLIRHPVYSPIVAVVVTILGYLLSLSLNAITDHFLPLLILILVGLITGRYTNGPASYLSVIGMLWLFTAKDLMRSPIFGIPFLEAACIGVGASWIGCELRHARTRHHQHQQEKTAWLGVMANVHQRQRAFLREVLSSVTNGKLQLCETKAELPAALPYAPGEKEILLASANLSEVRERIRRAAEFIDLSPTAKAEIVIAGAEAALNAVVHAEGGIAEIRADQHQGRIQIWVSDKGGGIDDNLIHRATLEQGYSSKGSLGQGFSLMVSTCDQIHLLTGSTGTIIVLEIDRQAV